MSAKDTEAFVRKNDDIFIATIALAIMLGVILLCIPPVSAHGNLSVYDYGSNYIIWNVGGNTLIWLDGQETDVYGYTYGQYELQPDTEHIACNIDGNCTGIRTKPDSMSVFMRWGAYFLLVILCVLSYFAPITAFPTLAFGLYLLGGYLPDISASFYEYSLVAVLLIMGCIAASAGFTRKG